VLKGSCLKNYQQLKFDPKDYVKDIYELSLLNLSLCYGLSRNQARQSELWQPPYGSVFPSPCDKLTHARSLFLERDGNLSVCCGVDKRLGNIKDRDIRRKLQKNPLLKKIRLAYDNLEGFCKFCDYSVKLHLCYGCRGNAYTYKSAAGTALSQDPMCFGRLAKNLITQGRLKEVVGVKHTEKILQYFKH
jgi:MoaA/NifB/PqqE/SkfB family radical SAM enzyme